MKEIYHKTCILTGMILVILIAGCMPFEGTLDDVREKAVGGAGNKNLVTLVRIEITSFPDKTSYAISENFNSGGLEVTAFYSDESSKIVTGYSYSGFDSVTYGNKIITVSYQGQIALFTVMVDPPGKTLVSIDIFSQPSQKDYAIGENLNLNNLIVRAVYSDFSFEPITDYTLSGFDSNKGGEKEVIVSYGGKITSFFVTVNARIFTVTFDSNGGSTEAIPSTMTVTEAIPAPSLGSLPEPPTMAGNTCTSWNTESDGSGSSFTASTPVAGNIKVYAQWKGNILSIKYASGGGSGSAPSNPSSSAYGTNVTMPACSYTRTGYTFAGWAVSGTGSIAGTYAAGAIVAVSALSTAIVDNNANITLTATWTGNILSISYDGGGPTTFGDPPSSPVSAIYGASIVMPENTYKRGGGTYSFKGWAVSGTGSIKGTYAAGAIVAVSALSTAIANGNAEIVLTATWVQQ